MSFQLNLLPKIVPLVMRHVAGYLQLLEEEASDLARLVAKRIIAILIAILAAGFSMALACVWILNAVWDTPWRQAAIASLFAVFAIATIVAVLFAIRSDARRTPFHRLRSEWNEDRKLIDDLLGNKPVGERSQVDIDSSPSSPNSET